MVAQIWHKFFMKKGRLFKNIIWKCTTFKYDSFCLPTDTTVEMFVYWLKTSHTLFEKIPGWKFVERINLVGCSSPFARYREKWWLVFNSTWELQTRRCTRLPRSFQDWMEGQLWLRPLKIGQKTIRALLSINQYLASLFLWQIVRSKTGQTSENGWETWVSLTRHCFTC